MTRDKYKQLTYNKKKYIFLFYQRRYLQLRLQMCCGYRTHMSDVSLNGYNKYELDGYSVKKIMFINDKMTL